ncbi:MAG TPA: hypothetical protein VFT39_10665 [Vicinamibacterales bacterium]|nr:hypothetical protein [Vicinamibacterales bacterium]
MSFYVEFSFSAHVALLESLLNHSRHFVDEVERRLLNVQGRRDFPIRDRHYIEQVLSSCFFDSIPRDLAGLKEQLSAAHRADGFEPVQQEGGAHDFSAAALVAFAYSYWTDSRWPGRNGRMAYAHTIYSVFVLNQLQYLCLRVWDDGHGYATARLREIQDLLDRLNGQSGANVFMRTTRWLLQTAQSPLTRFLQPYFIIANHISRSFEDDERLEIHRAGAVLAGGHLRSQLRYRARESRRPIDDLEVLSVTRNSNSMDVALLLRDLVPLLDAYRIACATDAQENRWTLSNAILQGLSADPELLLTRFDLLGPAAMIEEVFIEREDGRAAYSAFGSSHLHMLSRYRELIGALATQLKEDASRLEPSCGLYSPFGIVYGFCGDILSNMAISRLVSQNTSSLTLEDMFSSDGSLEGKLSKAREWEALPRHSAERARFEHSTEWAAKIFSRLMTALDARASHGDALNASGLHRARLFVVQEGHVAQAAHDFVANAVSAQEHCVTSDLKRALATGATAFPRSQILSDRKEGRFLASVESEGKWFAVSKVLLTVCLCQGKDAVITDVPAAVIDVLRLTCRELLEIV